MTRIQLMKDDLTKDQIAGIMELVDDENWQDWDIYQDDEFVVAEIDEEDGVPMINFMTEELGIGEELLDIE